MFVNANVFCQANTRHQYKLIRVRLEAKTTTSFLYNISFSWIQVFWGQDYKEKHKTRLKTNVKRTVLNNTKLRHLWAQIVSWAPIHARKTFIILAPGVYTPRNVRELKRFCQANTRHRYKLIRLWIEAKMATWILYNISFSITHI